MRFATYLCASEWSKVFKRILHQWFEAFEVGAHFLFEFLLVLLFLGGELPHSFLDASARFLRANAEAGQSDDCRRRDFAELLGHGFVLSNG